MKKVLTLIFIAALIVIVSAAFRDVPKGHWAESYVNKLAETGIVTGFPDGTFRGDESVTRYQMSLFLYRVLDYISTQTDASLRPIISHIESLNMQLKTQIEKNAIIDSLSTQVDLLEEYANVIYDAVGTKASAEDLEELTNSVNEIIGELRQMIDDLKVALDIHDSDILKIYDTLGMLSDEIVKIQEILAEYEEVRNLVESLAVKVDMHDQDIVNIYDALAQELSPLETIIASKADKEAVEMLTNRVELLEEYTNSIYETLGTKVSYDDLELLMAELDERISYIEADMLNIKSTVETGLPALRDMLYELSASFAATEERLSSYVEVSVATAKEEVKNEIQSALDDMRVVLNMHDQDIVNIYDNLSAKADREQVDALEERLAAIEEDIVGLSEILSGLAAQIGDTDYLLRKAIENTQKDLQAKIDTKASKDDVEVVLNRVDLLEEYANILYETLGTKASVDEIEMLMAELDERISAIETDVLNIRSTIETGLPALRDMLYELSANLAAVEERLTSYVEVSIQSVRKEILDELQPTIEDLKAMLEIHDDRLNLVENQLVSLTQVVEEVKADKSEVEEVNQKVDALKAEKAQDVKRLEEMATWGIATGVIGIVIGVIGLGKAFGWF